MPVRGEDGGGSRDQAADERICRSLASLFSRTGCSLNEFFPEGIMTSVPEFDRACCGSSSIPARHTNGDRESPVRPARIRAQTTLNLKMIQLQLDHRNIPGEIAPNVRCSNMEPCETAAFTLCFDHHACLLFNNSMKSV